MFKGKHLFSLFLLFIANISNAFCANYTTSSIINSGGSISSSSNYSTHYSLGQLAGENISSASYQIQTDILLIPDTDRDGILDNTDNCLLFINVNQVNNDEDTLGDACDLDDDNDGLSDVYELNIGTNPLKADTDNDGLLDSIEVTLGTNPLIADTDIDGVLDGADAFPLDPSETIDTDGDGIGNNTDNDDDNDGLSDSVEIAYGSDPLDSDSLPVIANGDLAPFDNPDGFINTADVMIAYQLVLNQRVAGPLQYAYGDMNRDGLFNAIDIVLIQQVAE